jgi:hypothetical protein
MKAITICQPFPHLIMTGEKPVENRSWFTTYRGPLAIHAGKSRGWLADGDEQEAAAEGHPLVFGAVVAVCVLKDCLKLEKIQLQMYDEKYPQLKSRAHCFGPWCWVLTDVIRLSVPVPYKGQQGFFDVPGHLIQIPEQREAVL